MFIQNSVVSNGSYLNICEIDPLMVSIQFLIQSRGQTKKEFQGYFEYFEDIFKDEDIKNKKGLEILSKNKRISRNLHKICDIEIF